MRKVILSGVAALGFLAIGLTMFGHAGFGHAGQFRRADADGSGADVRVTRHNLVAMVDNSHAGRPMLVAMVSR